MSNLTDNAILSVFADSIAQVSRKNLENLTLDQPISNLGLDSLALLEMIGLLEEAYAVRIDEYALVGEVTLRDVADQIRAQQCAAEAP